MPVSVTQTQEAVPKAKAPKKGILAGGVEYSSVPELRKKARELKLVAASPTPNKALCIDVLNEYAQVQKLRVALDASFTTEDVPEDEDEAEDAADADGASVASGDDDSASDGGTIEDLGKVGKLPSALAFGTDAEKKSAARMLYHHLRGSGTAYMLGLCGGADKREQLVYCAARLHHHIATKGAVLSDSIATQDLLVAAPFFPIGIEAENANHLRASAAAAAGAGGGGAGAAGAGGAGGDGGDSGDGDGDGDDSGNREAIFTLDDFARLLSTMMSAEAEQFVSAYRASLSREQLDTRMRNTDLFKGIATVFNGSGNYMEHPDLDHEAIGAMDPNSDAIFEKVRSGETLAKKWCEIKGHYSPVHHNFTKVRARQPRGYESQARKALSRCVRCLGVGSFATPLTAVVVTALAAGDEVVSGHHDGESRDIGQFLPSDKASKIHKIILYCHLCFYETPLEELATKGLPGGGLDSNTVGAGGGPIEPKRGFGGPKRGGLTGDDLKNALNTETDVQIGQALADMGKAQVDMAKRQKLSFMCDLKDKGHLNAGQQAALAKAIDKQLEDLL